jgi:hypothetical protein
MEKTCRQCGSARIIPQLPVLDSKANKVQVEIVGKPNAWVFQEAVYGTINAQICGECGHTELWTSHFRELYEKHEKSINSPLNYGSCRARYAAATKMASAAAASRWSAADRL